MVIRRGALPSDNFAVLSNQWMRDARLSFRARGLLALLATHAPGYQVGIRSLAAQNPEGADAIRSAVNELVALGYLHRSRVRGADGRLAEAEWELDDPWAPASENPTQAEPTPAEPTPIEDQSLEDQTEELMPADAGADDGESGSSPGEHPDFPAFYAAYPRKVGRRRAEAAWRSALKRATAEDIMRGVERFAALPHPDPQYVPHPTTWLNGDRWADDLNPVPAVTVDPDWWMRG